MSVQLIAYKNSKPRIQRGNGRIQVYKYIARTTVPVKGNHHPHLELPSRKCVRRALLSSNDRATAITHSTWTVALDRSAAAS